MRLFTFIQVSVLLSLSPELIRAAPIDEPNIQRDIGLYKRVPGDSAQDPIMAELACTGVEPVCEADCIAMLCHGKPQIMQRDTANRAAHYAQSGAGLTPFQDDAAMMQRRGISTPDPLYNSAEETTYESVAQGGVGTVLFPVPRDLNLEHGRRIGAMYTNHGITNGKWFKQLFTFLNSQTPHCIALMQDPPDDSICRKRLGKDFTGKYDLKPYAFVKNQVATNPVTFLSLFQGYSVKREDGSEVLEISDQSKREVLTSNADTE
ncbi:hypothetical protein MFRU_036g00100 [Monilinia fructicola]|uniref:Uncharacterized protein n=1 Tax=Monilinia fructicola TaxID=38448 RepID=A0A5M9J5H4_MONFR|nr:hypothetical protein EYC84_011916 [Monilinia fructicola]KAG4026776.1 hypothetical protein MFRU_036g00100 [Monilinia fructicola]